MHIHRYIIHIHTISIHMQHIIKLSHKMTIYSAFLIINEKMELFKIKYHLCKQKYNCLSKHVLSYMPNLDLITKNGLLFMFVF